MLTKERQKYDREFKQEAVELSFARIIFLRIALETFRVPARSAFYFKRIDLIL